MISNVIKYTLTLAIDLLTFRGVARGGRIILRSGHVNVPIAIL